MIQSERAVASIDELTATLEQARVLYGRITSKTRNDCAWQAKRAMLMEELGRVLRK